MPRKLRYKVFAGTLRKLRNDYEDTWEVKWPHDDDYLAELWLEVRKEGSKPRNLIYSRTAVLMRESHEFTPSNPGGKHGDEG